MLAVQFPEHLIPGLPSKNNMTTDLYNLSGEKIGDLNLPKSVFDVKINEVLVSQAIRVLQSRSRSAHAKTKHRGEIAGTNQKMWAQKGTGRARHSTAKAPQFVGGGSAHGWPLKNSALLPLKLKSLGILLTNSGKRIHY